MVIIRSWFIVVNSCPSGYINVVGRCNPLNLFISNDAVRSNRKKLINLIRTIDAIHIQVWKVLWTERWAAGARIRWLLNVNVRQAILNAKREFSPANVLLVSLKWVLNVREKTSLPPSPFRSGTISIFTITVRPYVAEKALCHLILIFFSVIDNQEKTNRQ